MLLAETLLTLAAQCAPDVAPQTLFALVRAESALDPYAIGVNGPRAVRPAAASRSEAVAAARGLIAAGHDIDLGLAQINVRNLPRLGLSVEDAFEPCRNLAAGAALLREGYARAVSIHGPGQASLRVALSYYNTGSASRGFANGYVARVLRQADARSAPPAPSPALPAHSPPAWDVFGRAGRQTARFVISVSGATP